MVTTFRFGKAWSSAGRKSCWPLLQLEHRSFEGRCAIGRVHISALQALHALLQQSYDAGVLRQLLLKRADSSLQGSMCKGNWLMLT